MLTECINGAINPLSDGDYWVYIGCDDTDDDFDDDDSIVYRSPGKLTIEYAFCFITKTIRFL